MRLLGVMLMACLIWVNVHTCSMWIYEISQYCDLFFYDSTFITLRLINV